MENLIEQINERLLEIIEEFGDSKVKEAMKYSLMAGGKRIRPVMMLQVIRSYDKNYQDYLDIACAIEMIHTYSLIHDDLPGMDNDDLRRGRLTCHKQFDEATATIISSRWPQINDPVSSIDNLLIMFNDYYCITTINNTIKQK